MCARFRSFLAWSFSKTCQALINLWKSPGVSPSSNAVPRVKPYEDNEEKKFVVFEASQIISSVGLINATDEFSYKCVIKTGDAFDRDMRSNTGKVGDIHQKGELLNFVA